MKLIIKNKTLEIKECKTLFSQAKGLMFSRKIKENKALLFFRKYESILDSSIHMFFVFYKIKVFWLDKNFKIVDQCLAKPFKIYAPKIKSKYILETHENVKMKTGDIIKFT